MNVQFLPNFLEYNFNSCLYQYLLPLMTQSLGLDPISGPKLLDYWNPFDELKEVEVKEVRTEIFIHRLNLK